MSYAQGNIVKKKKKTHTQKEAKYNGYLFGKEKSKYLN